MRYIGIDLAWGDNNRTGLAELESDGRLVRSASVTTDDEIAAFLGDRERGVVVAIDAPLVVPNESGQRSCERELGRLFGRYRAGAYPANRGNPAFNPEPRGARLARRFQWELDPGIRPRSDSSVAIEVYPHPAMVSLFPLELVIPYKGKKGRDVPSRQRAFRILFDAVEGTCGALLHLDDSDRWQQLRILVEGTPRQVDLDTVEDEVDAIFCAYLAWLWTNDGDAMMVIGDVAAGYIVTPLPPDPDRDAFLLSQEAGRIRFGDGLHGRRPRSEDTLTGAYRTGGGSAGAVPAAGAPSAHQGAVDERVLIAPTGQCFCGCGQATRPGRYFVAAHDRSAETRVIKDHYGSIAQFVVAHGYGPDHGPGGHHD